MHFRRSLFFLCYVIELKREHTDRNRKILSAFLCFMNLLNAAVEAVEITTTESSADKRQRERERKKEREP